MNDILRKVNTLLSRWLHIYWFDMIFLNSHLLIIFFSIHYLRIWQPIKFLGIIILILNLWITIVLYLQLFCIIILFNHVLLKLHINFLLVLIWGNVIFKFKILVGFGDTLFNFRLNWSLIGFGCWLAIYTLPWDVRCKFDAIFTEIFI